MSQQTTPLCPRCRKPTFDGATCWNNDCNFPAHESRNARNQREAAEAAERVRRKREAEAQAKSVRKGKGAKPAKPPVDGWERIGGILGLAGAACGAWVGAQAAPDAPLAWAITAFIGAALAYWMRRLLVYGGIVVAGLALLADRDGADPTGSVSDVEAAQIAATVAPPGPPAAIAETRIIDALCLSNETAEMLTFAYSGNDAEPARLTLDAGYRRILWSVQEKGTAFPVNALIEAERYGSVRVPLGRTEREIGANGNPADLVACDDPGIPSYRLFKDGSGGLRIEPF